MERTALMETRTMDDPTQYYQELLGQPPFQDAETGLWVVARDKDVRRILPDTKNFSNRLTLFPHFAASLSPAAIEVLGELRDVPATTAGGDGELHDRARGAIRDTFPTTMPRVQATTGSIVQSRINELILDLPHRATERDGTADIIHDFAWELPLRVILDVLGFPPDRYEDIKKWSMGQIALTWGKLEPAEQVDCARGLVSLWHECQKLVADYHQKLLVGDAIPDNMTTRLLKDGRLNEDEVASILLNFAVAGHETTANAIGNAVHHQLVQPGAWQELAENHHNPAYVSQVVEEELKLNPPIIGWSRVTNEAVNIGGVDIPKDERILLLLGAANQDTYLYLPTNERPQRRIGDHLSFGLGAHYCVGAPLARLEMHRALVTLAEAYPNMQLQPGFTEQIGKYHANLGFRALKSLPVTLGEPGGNQPEH